MSTKRNLIDKLNSFHSIKYLFLLTVFIYMLDRLLKELLLWKQSFFCFHIYFNPYLAFGIPLPSNLIKLIIALILIALLFYLAYSKTREQPLFVLGLSAMWLGAFSNFLDRLFLPGVVDYLYLPLFSYLNLADIMISGGVILIIWRLIFVNKQTIEPKVR